MLQRPWAITIACHSNLELFAFLTAFLDAI
jgi:hypothetical protein